jgi:heat shock protein HtpX
MLVGLVCSAIAYFFTLLTRFAISRKREYMADAGGAELCGNPLALASALKKISGAPGLQNVEREDVAQLFIIKPHAFSSGLQGFFNSMFATHPETSKRIQILEQF